MPKPKVEDRNSVTDKDGFVVAVRLPPNEVAALNALKDLEQAQVTARGAPYKVGYATIFRMLLRAAAIEKGVWEASSAPAAGRVDNDEQIKAAIRAAIKTSRETPETPAADPMMTTEEMKACFSRARAALPPDHPRHPAQVRAQVLTALTAISAGRDSHHKLIDLPTLKDALSGILSDDINEALLALQESREIDLKAANDPSELSQVPHPERGFVVPDRGLIYFAIVPEPKQPSLFGMTPAPSSPAPKTTPKSELSAQDAVDLLKQLRDAGFVTYAQIGEELGYLNDNPGSNVGKWASGKLKVSPDKLPKLREIVLRIKQEQGL